MMNLLSLILELIYYFGMTVSQPKDGKSKSSMFAAAVVVIALLAIGIAIYFNNPHSVEPTDSLKIFKV